MAFPDPPAGFDPPLRAGFNYQGGIADGVDRQFVDGQVGDIAVAESAAGRCPECFKPYDSHDGWRLMTSKRDWLPECLPELDDIDQYLP